MFFITIILELVVLFSFLGLTAREFDIFDEPTIDQVLTFLLISGVSLILALVFFQMTLIIFR